LCDSGFQSICFFCLLFWRARLVGVGGALFFTPV
jgi:hypothetical protein